MSDEGFFWGKDGGKYRTIFERNAADTRYEQQEAIKQQLQEQNNIEQQKIQSERENAELKARAIRQAEEDKFLYQAYLQSKQQSFEEEQRKLKLCDDLGVDYEDLKKFDYYLGLTNKEITSEIEAIESEMEIKSKS